MQQTVINGIPTTELSIDGARQLGQYMENMNYARPEEQASSFFFLVDLKQELINLECYEVLADFKRLEDWHGIHIPFKVRAS